MIAGNTPEGGISKTRVHGIWVRKISVPGSRERRFGNTPVGVFPAIKMSVWLFSNYLKTDIHVRRTYTKKQHG